MKNQFTDLYKNLPNTKLVDIVTNSDNYTDEAFQAATVEIKNRQLSDSDIEDAKKINAEKFDEERLSDEKLDFFISVPKNAFNRFIDVFNPLTPKTAEKSLKLVCSIYFVIAINKIIKYKYFIVDFFDGKYPYDFSIVFWLFDILILPIGLILTWSKFKLGRYLLTFYLAYNSFLAMTSVYFSLTRPQTSNELTVLFSRPNLLLEFGSLFFLLISLYFFNKKDIRAVVDK